MKKRVLYNLKRNAISAYTAAIEIHNKPNIEYRYETVIMLLINAWKLLLKAYIWKYMKKKIYDKEGNTISVSKCIEVVKNKIFSDKSIDNKYIAYLENVNILNEYRKNITHYYNENSIEAILFSVVAKNTLDFTSFYEDFFDNTPIEMKNLMILPLGFKLPFNPIDYILKKKQLNEKVDYKNSFIDLLLSKTVELTGDNIEESLFIGFDLYLTNVKNVSNSDIITAISNDKDDVDLVFNKKIKYSSSEKASEIHLNDDAIICNYPYSYKDLTRLCREKIDGFKQDKKYNQLVTYIKTNQRYCFQRKLNPNKEKTSVTCMYNVEGLKYIIDNYK